MRLNSTQVGEYVFSTDKAPGAKDCTSNSCSPTEIAQSDKANWASEVQELPDGKGVISKPVAGVDNMVDILVTWEEKDSKLTDTLATAGLCSQGEGVGKGEEETGLRRCIKLRVHI